VSRMDWPLPHPSERHPRIERQHDQVRAAGQRIIDEAHARDREIARLTERVRDLMRDLDAARSLNRHLQSEAARATDPPEPPLTTEA
jgi:hypothetical protein